MVISLLEGYATSTQAYSQPGERAVMTTYYILTPIYIISTMDNNSLPFLMKSNVFMYGLLLQSIRPHVWYFVIADCDASIHKSNLNYYLEMYNADGTHFSHEDCIPSRVYPVLTILFWLTLIPLAMLVRSHLRRVGGMELHPAIQHVIIGLGLFLASLVLKAIDYRVFSRDGVGLKNLNVTAEIFNWMAQLVVSLELLSIAFGWSVDAILSPSRRYNTSQSFLTKITTMIVAVHVVLILLSRQYDDTHSKYHESETVPALLLILFRILLGGVFFFGVTNMHMRETCLLQKSFVTKFAIFGGAYFISIPAVVTIASTIFAPYLRHQMVVLGSLVVQMVALTSLAILMLTRNEFTEITTISAACLPIKRL